MYATIEPSLSLASPSEALMSTAWMWEELFRLEATSAPSGPESWLAMPTLGTFDEPRMR